MKRSSTERKPRVAAKILVALCACLSLAALPSAVQAQDLYTYGVGVFGGFGGSFDVNPDAGLDNISLQASFSMLTERRTLVSLRVGSIDFSGDSGKNGFDVFSEADLTYLTVAGEYRVRRAYYDSGLFLGLGGYRLEGTLPGGGTDDETALGFTAGVTGEFPINSRFSVQVEFAGHFANLDTAQFFGTGHFGLVWHF